MKTALFCISTFLALFQLTGLHAADDSQLTPLKAADDERVAAMIAADRARLTNVFSDDLRYAHSSGAVDTKASLIEAITGGKTKYVAYEYTERNFTFPSPSIALMTGRAHIQAQTATGTTDAIMSFLGAWREEKGQWHFLAWQSCKLPPATPAVPAAQNPKETPAVQNQTVLNVKADGSVVWNRKTIPLPELKDKLKDLSAIYPDYAIIVRGDKQVPFRFITAVLDTCHAAKIWNVAFATSTPE